MPMPRGPPNRYPQNDLLGFQHLHAPGGAREETPMANYEIVRIRCDECGRVRVVRVWQGGEDMDLLEAGPGEYVERVCGVCEKETEHQVVMAEVQAAA